MSNNRVIVQLKPACSDGDPLHVPSPGSYSQIDPPTLYLEKIGQQWVQNQGNALPGVQYVLAALPAGYTLWQRPRPSDPRLFDKYLYGHPAQRKFDSPNRFYPHFEWLMNNSGNSIGCPCTVCCGSSGLLPKASPNSSKARISNTSSRRSSDASVTMQSGPSSVQQLQQLAIMPNPRPVVQLKGRPKKVPAGMDKANVDREGTPDIYRNLINKLRRHEHIDELIREPLSPDWRAEQERLPQLLENIKTQEQWMPRNGDIVLYIRDLPDAVNYIRNDGQLELYNEDKNKFFDVSQWKAGLVTETADGSTDRGQTNPSWSGIRVEAIPHPNDPDRSVSKQYKYVDLRQTWPFALWQVLLEHVHQEKWHATIKNALALASTVSLIGKHRFRGTWPNANIYCHGIYVGFEMLAVGDTIRLLPNKKTGPNICTDIMIIKSIRLKWTNLDKASDNDYDEGRPYNSEIWIYGSAYTSDPSRSDKAWHSDHTDLPQVAEGYSTWHPLHPVDKELAIPYSRILGRLYERDAIMKLLQLGSSKLPSLDIGRQAVTEARAYSRKHDNRIAEEPHATWYWGDNRADALNLRTINGLDVSKFDLERDVKDMRKKYRLLDAVASGQNLGDVKPDREVVPGGRGLRGFMAPKLPFRPVDSRATSTSGDSIETSSDSSISVSRKRMHIVDLPNDDEMEEEIRQHTKVIEDDRATISKKARVMVVID
ncbi:transcription-silencing clr2 [Pyrenophora seminiperda CCB06]|uniref:Transcription-silencing clr2 n=1 Tax=Pyrenophora seminiperda CCB06 TaxID=1302712 RepID=A0A3M7LYK6_9PLEO|nr:transcription-silencing clr2 [Pyrenophora seminiperda CCB06]